MNLIPYMQRAIALATENVRAQQGGPFGAVIVKDDQIIAEGTNLVTASNDPTAHAEVVAIRRACEKLQSFQLTDCYLFSSCEPCPMCLSAIYWSRPKGVFFAATAADASAVGFDDSFIYEELALERSERKLSVIHLTDTELQKGLPPFDLWKTSTGRIDY